MTINTLEKLKKNFIKKCSTTDYKSLLVVYVGEQQEVARSVNPDNVNSGQGKIDLTPKKQTPY